MEICEIYNLQEDSFIIANVIEFDDQQVVVKWCNTPFVKRVEVFELMRHFEFTHVDKFESRKLVRQGLITYRICSICHRERCENQEFFRCCDGNNHCCFMICNKCHDKDSEKCIKFIGSLNKFNLCKKCFDESQKKDN